MELKEYQQKALEKIRIYLENLSESREKTQRLPLVDFTELAWTLSGMEESIFHRRRNGLEEFLPNFTLKIPTGGGKTFLAVKTIDLINRLYLNRQTGLIVWVVPTTQIYNQTIKNLKDKNHPYRQHLDIASGNKTLIKERTEKFTPEDISENLVILMLMLPAASRTNREQLRMFRDNGNFQQFFPYEDDIRGQEKILELFPTLHTYQEVPGIWGKQIITSLGNTIAVLKPIIILDESHKGRSPLAQDTLKNLNPSVVVELSATPHDLSNILVDIKGIDLNREEMIKLDLHITRKVDVDWKNTLLESINQRNVLETKAKEYEANKNIYIRPICLIQVERTGRDQRGSGYIHSEDVKEYLIKIGISEEEIAIKTSQKDELKVIDDADGLLSKNVQVKYIITKQALQEGWDCPFAYILTILTNPQSSTALTQLVGRILRQPYAKKTGIPELDESYVFTFQRSAANILEEIKNGFKGEGLGDLTTRIATEEGFNENEQTGLKTYNLKPEFKNASNHTILPVFAIEKDGEWSTVNYENDIAAFINWSKIDISSIKNLNMNITEVQDVELTTNLSPNTSVLIETYTRNKKLLNGITVDPIFLTRYLSNLIPNPWISFDLADKTLNTLIKHYNLKLVANNFLFIIEELEKLIQSEKDRLAKEVFDNLLKKNKLRFLIIKGRIGFKLPNKNTVKNITKTLTKENSQPLQKSLFDFVPEENFNETEKEVAWYLEDQEKLLFWYRNIERKDYAIQGWRKNKVYPDFIFNRSNKNSYEFDTVFVLETKGLHLVGSEDTEYKKSLLGICNSLAKKEKYGQIDFLKDKAYRFELLHEAEWKNRLNEILK
ncbi:DEAD/DEAH box helicase family protein [Candidatus Woesebacteria bacterium]|nr:DEAD/DEAH box helicase family protein [Candidatus Woesebacteria bacterium]